MKETDIFEQYEKSFQIVDTYTERAMAQSREITLALQKRQDESVSDDERMQLNQKIRDTLETMNNECPYRTGRVQITGEVYQAVPGDQQGQFSIQRVTCQRRPAISTGYAILNLDVEESAQSRSVVGQVFYLEDLSPVASTNPLVMYTPTIYAIAEVGSVDITATLPDPMNTEQLSKSVPELLNQIDTLLASTNTDGEAFMSLAELSIDYEHTPYESRSGLVSYLNRRLEFDKQVPYAVKLEGLVTVIESGERIIHSLQPGASRLIQPLALTLGQVPTLNEHGELEHTSSRHFMLHSRLIEPSPGAADIDIILPAGVVKSMESIRSVFYPSEQPVRD